MDAPIIIAGSGRSGTTWVQDVLAIANDRDTVFEPLHPAGAKKARPFSYKYHDPSEKVDDLYRFINTALKGEMRTLWAVYRIRPDKFNPIKHKQGLLHPPYRHVYLLEIHSELVEQPCHLVGIYLSRPEHPNRDQVY